MSSCVAVIFSITYTYIVITQRRLEPVVNELQVKRSNQSATVPTNDGEVRMYCYLYVYMYVCIIICIYMNLRSAYSDVKDQ